MKEDLYSLIYCSIRLVCIICYASCMLGTLADVRLSSADRILNTLRNVLRKTGALTVEVFLLT